MKILRRIFALIRKRKLETEMVDEMRHHVELQADLNLKAGMNPDDARYAAQRQFGNVTGIQERAREQRSWVWLEQWWKDAGFVGRSLIRARGFSFAVWLTLVVGVGVATIVFVLTSKTLIAQPYPYYERLFLIGSKEKEGALSPYRLGIHLQAYQEQATAFSDYAAVCPEITNVLVDGEPVLANLLGASRDCFRVLGIRPLLGRNFLPQEYYAGADDVVIITDLFWRRHFNASPGVLGRKIAIDHHVCTVVGVLAAGQSFPPAFVGDVYRPLVLKVDPATPLTPIVYIIGRLRNGVSKEVAQRQLAGIKMPTMPSWASSYLAGQEVVLSKPIELARPETLWMMFIAAGLLYVIACLNAMNLILVRLLGRRLELSIRFALGGTRGRIVRLILMECFVLALLAGVSVMVIAKWYFPPLFAALMHDEAFRYVPGWEWDTLSCIAVLSLLAGSALVVLPVWRLLGAEISPSLKDSGRAMSGGRRINLLRTGLVILQTALAVVLLSGTGLLVQSLEKLRHVDLGFDPTGKLKVQISFPHGYDLTPEAQLQLFDRLQKRMLSVPGVRDVSIGQDVLLVGKFWGTAQLQMADGSYRPVAGSFAAENFLKTSGLKLKSGRWLSDKRGVFEVVINETLARARFGTEDPVGKSIKLQVSGNADLPVVGVVRDVKENNRTGAGIRLYMANWVYPANISMLMLRMDRDPGEEFSGTIRKIIYDFDPKLIVYSVSSLSETVDQSMAAERNTFTGLSWLSGIALGLAVLGLFSVITFTVNSRLNEFGIRLALGATPVDLHRLVLSRGVITVAVGVVLGTGIALGLTRYMRSLLFETVPYDPAVYFVVALVLFLAAVIASWLPARRAAKVNPVMALRAE